LKDEQPLFKVKIEGKLWMKITNLLEEEMPR
jgi:hypothetical protein